jgi:uncharacterized protein YbjT (DUF2867 family)
LSLSLGADVDSADLFCHDLTSRPQPEIGKVLVTGATGYIGGRLVPELLARGYQVRVLVRSPSSEYRERWPGAEIVVADALKQETLRKALDEIHTAYYLIHSLYLGPKEFTAADIKAAANFRSAAESKGVKRIIYLGGLGDINRPLSKHLRSRIEVAQELDRGKVPVTILRAAIIIGSGSASFEIIKHLAIQLHVILSPGWERHKCQPIGIRDVIKYLVGVLEIPETSGMSFDIGGEDILTYKMMIRIMAKFLNKRIFFVPIPFSHIGFYAYYASLITPVPLPLVQCLFEGLKNDAVCQDDSIKKFLPFIPLGYEEAIRRANIKEAQDKVYTRWSDAYPPAHHTAQKLHELKGLPKYTASHSLITEKRPSSIFKSICNIGGKEGWFRNNWMWRLRGMVDRILLGVGTSRGRRSHSTLKTHDVLDFWRVEDIQRDKRLLLRAEMKLPGEAWLEFKLKPVGKRNRLSVIAYYDTNKLFGDIYWFIFKPFHNVIFTDLIRQIEKRS